MHSSEIDENPNVMMGDTLELVKLISSSLASEIKCHVPGGCFLSHERGHVGLKMGFSQGGDVSSLAIHLNHL